MRSRLQLAGHPVHPMLVNFPIALFSTALLFDVAYLWQGESLWYWLAFYEMVIGYLGAVGAAIAGAVDYFFADLTEPRVYRRAAVHASLAVLVLLVYAVNLGLRLGPTPLDGDALWAAVGLSAVGVAALTAGAWYGGELVYIHRLGVRE